MLDKKILKQIQDVAIRIDHDAAFGGKSKGNKHLSRVVKIATFLAKRTGADLQITEAGAWLHDSALPSGNDYDPEKNAKIVRKIVKGIDLTKEEVGRIAECAASHEGTKTPASLEAMIVHDSDVIEKTGMLGIIRHTWKLTNSGKIDPTRITTRDAQGVLTHIEWRKKQLQLPLSRRLARRFTVRLSIEKTVKIMQVTARLAERGVITEKIIPVVSKQLTANERKVLKSQINLSYLK